MASRRQSRAATTLLNTTGSASANVIAKRMTAFSNPASLLSPWHQAETKRMFSEKLDAAGEGMLAASTTMGLLPCQLMQVLARPSTWSPMGWMGAWQDMAELWIGVGNAALRPARNKALRNQARLGRKGA